MPRACTGCISHVGRQEQALRAVSSEVAWLNTLLSHFAVRCSCWCCMQLLVLHAVVGVACILLHAVPGVILWLPSSINAYFNC